MMSHSPQAICKITGEQFYGILPQPEVKHSFKLSNKVCEINNILFQRIKTQGEGWCSELGNGCPPPRDSDPVGLGRGLEICIL